MRKIILSLLLPIVIGTTIKAQNNLNDKAIYKIELDYNDMQNPLPINKKSIKNLKVGTILLVSVKNLPNGAVATFSGAFENGNLEYGKIFQNILETNFDKNRNNTETEPGEKKEEPPKQNEPKNVDKAIEEKTNLKKDFEEKKDTSLKKLENVNNNLQEKFKNRKINIFQIKNYLDLYYNRNFLDSLNKIKAFQKNVKFNNAYGEMLWYNTTALTYAQQNINDLNIEYEKLINKYAKKTDSIILTKNKLENEYKDLKKMNDSLAKALEKSTKTFLPIQIQNTDFSEFELKVVYKNETQKMPLLFNNIGGFKLDFSLGVFNAFYENKSYKVNKLQKLVGTTLTPVDTINVITETSLGKSNISLGVLSHGYTRLSKNFSLGLSTGFSYAPTTKNLNILAGVSALLGRQQRLTFTGGIMFTKMKVLETFEAGKQYHQSLLKINEELAYSDKSISPILIGVSYNLNLVKTAVPFKVN